LSNFFQKTIGDDQMSHATVDDALVESVVSKIAEAIQPEKIILFGSRAKGKGRPDSDIDLLIIKEAKQSKRELKLRIRRLFPRQNFSMDLFVLTPEEFQRQKSIANTIARAAMREGKTCEERLTWEQR
jgi:predicted nucleotidyltransferase